MRHGRGRAERASAVGCLLLALVAAPAGAAPAEAPRQEKRMEGTPHGTRALSVLELRQYTLHPGARDTLVSLFDEHFVESQEALPEWSTRLAPRLRSLTRGEPERLVLEPTPRSALRFRSHGS